jgi:Zn-finger nucleic acid-binding protein
MAFGLCPNCGSKVDIGSDPDIGLHPICESCRAELVVVWLNPIELSIIDYEDYGQFDDDLYVENIQKIRKNKGEYDANRKNQKKR